MGWVYEHSALAPSPPSGLWSVADGESVECHPAPTVSQAMGSSPRELHPAMGNGSLLVLLK